MWSQSWGHLEVPRPGWMSEEYERDSSDGENPRYPYSPIANWHRSGVRDGHKYPGVFTTGYTLQNTCLVGFITSQVKYLGAWGLIADWGVTIRSGEGEYIASSRGHLRTRRIINELSACFLEAQCPRFKKQDPPQAEGPEAE